MLLPRSGGLGIRGLIWARQCESQTSGRLLAEDDLSLGHALSLPFPSSDGDLSETQRSINQKPNRTKCYGITNMERPDENDLGGISDIFLISSVIYETQIAEGKE